MNDIQNIGLLQHLDCWVVGLFSCRFYRENQASQSNLNFNSTPNTYKISLNCYLFLKFYISVKKVMMRKDREVRVGAVSIKFSNFHKIIKILSCKGYVRLFLSLLLYNDIIFSF